MRSLEFKVPESVWATLRAEGERQRAERNVVFPPGPWTEEMYVRYAIQRAMTDTYPELVLASENHLRTRPLLHLRPLLPV